MKLLTFCIVFLAIIYCAQAFSEYGKPVRLGARSFKGRVRRRDCSNGRNKEKGGNIEVAASKSKQMDGKDSAETSVISSRKIVNLAANVKTSSASDKINNSNNNNGNEDDNNGDNGDGGDGEEENNAKNKSQDTKSKGKSSEEKKPSSNTSSGSFSGRLTYYNPANGACGGSGYGDDDMVAALNAEQYGDVDSVSDYCGKCAQIEGDKATIVVKIIDACEGCGYGALDLSPSAFKKVTSDDGVSENVSWSWVDC